MLIEHIEYRNRDALFHISPFFMKLTLTLIRMSLQNYAYSMYSKLIECDNNKYLIIHQSNQKNNTFLNKDIIKQISKLIIVFNTIESEMNKYQIFHCFIQILSFIQYYSKDEIIKYEQIKKIIICLILYLINNNDIKHKNFDILMQYFSDFSFCKYKNMNIIPNVVSVNIYQNISNNSISKSKKKKLKQILFNQL